MKRKINYTEKDVIDSIKLREAGHSYAAIAEMAGVSPKTVRRYIAAYEAKQKKTAPKKEAVSPVPAVPHVPAVPPRSTGSAPAVERNATAKQVALAGISSRVLIKELYNRGYRIENGGLFVIEKKKVLINDILAEA